MQVRDWIYRFPGQLITVPAAYSLNQLTDRLLQESGLRDIYVVSPEGQLMGHISHKKIAHLVLAEHRPVHTRRQIMDRVTGGTAEDFMETHYVHAHPDERLDDVLDRQLRHEVEDMPVIDDEGAILGAINLSTVLRERIHAGKAT